jgi:hypothetical protein
MLALARGPEMCPLQAHCHFRLGELAYKSSDRAESHEPFTIAAAISREMGMQFWLDRADAAVSALLNRMLTYPAESQFVRRRGTVYIASLFPRSRRTSRQPYPARG